MLAAKRALNRFLLELLGPDDEVFLYRFDSNPELVHGWTTDRQKVSRELAMLRPRGGTSDPATRWRRRSRSRRPASIARRRW